MHHYARRRTDRGSLTGDDLIALPKDGHGTQVVQNVIVSEPLPGHSHARTVAAVTARVRQFLTQQALAFSVVAVVADDASAGDGRSARVAHDAGRPDVAIMHGSGTEGDGEPIDRPAPAPAVAIEVLSPHNPASEIRARMRRYFSAGTRMAWVIDPARRVVTVWHSSVGADLLDADQELDGEDVLPGFHMPVAELLDA